MSDGEDFDPCKICRHIPLFGTVLGNIISDKDITQREFGRRIAYSEAKVSKIILKNELSHDFDLVELIRIGKKIRWTPKERAELVRALSCYALRERGMCNE